MVTLCLCLLTAGNCLEYANNHQGASHSPQQQESSADNQATSVHQDHISDGETLHTLMPMQGFSPLHIPQFPGSLNMGFSPGLSNAGASSCSLTGNQSKARGASDCPGICPLCGATLRQARNLRRHLLSSCKYRFNTTQNSTGDSTMIEVKPEVELSSYNDQSVTFGTDSGSNSCEQIVCKPSLPSPTTHGSQSMMSTRSGVSSPTIAR